MPIRNPLLGIMDSSKRPPKHPGIAGVEDREIHLTDPTMEHYAGDNNAWRGTEMHGVATKEHATSYDPGVHSEENAHVISEHHDPIEHDPIDVRIVNEFNEEVRDFRAVQFPVGAIAQAIVGAHPKRLKVLIRNPSANVNPVYIGQDPTVASFTGFGLYPGQELSLSAGRAIYAVSPLGATLHIIDEFSIEL